MGRHEPIEYDGKKFAEEVMGTATEITQRWYDREITWRDRLIRQYKNEISILQEQRSKFTAPEANTGENPIPEPERFPDEQGWKVNKTKPDDPNATQALDGLDDEEPGE